MNSAIPGKVDLGAIRKQAEQVELVVKGKPVSSAPPWPLLQFLPQVPALVPAPASLSNGV